LLDRPPFAVTIRRPQGSRAIHLEEPTALWLFFAEVLGLEIAIQTPILSGQGHQGGIAAWRR
jgi:hypothetical protein